MEATALPTVGPAGREPSPVPPFPSELAWRDEWSSSSPQLESIDGQIKSQLLDVPILRVNQVDATRMDVEMAGMLREQFLKIFTYVQPGLLSDYEPELNLALEFLIWRFSVWLDRPTPGIALMNLRFRNERRLASMRTPGKVRTGLESPGLSTGQKLAYLALTAGVRYAWARVHTLSAFQQWGSRSPDTWTWRVWGLLQRGESACKFLGLLNFLVFLRTGRYRSLVERLVGAGLVYERPAMTRGVAFEYMSRQLVWNEFSEVLLLVLPLLNMGLIRRALLSPFSSSSSTSSIPDDACPICRSLPPNTPFAALPCRHLYCYYCLRTRALADPAFKCAACDVQVSSIRRHHPHVDLRTSTTPKP